MNIGLALLIGFIGRDRRFGFWGNFLISLILTPLVGVITILAQDTFTSEPESDDSEAADADPAAAS